MMHISFILKSDYPTDHPAVLDTPCRIGACETSFGNENGRGESAVCGVGAGRSPAPTPHTALSPRLVPEARAGPRFRQGAIRPTPKTVIIRNQWGQVLKKRKEKTVR